MTPSNLHEYNRLMNQVDLPDRVRTTVMNEVRRGNVRTARASVRPRRSWVRAATMGGCAVALAGALAVGLGAAGVLPVGPGASGPNGAAIDAPVSGNFFTLAAYAAENPNQTPGSPVKLSLGAFRPGGASGTDSGQMDTGFHFDATCTGDNISSITYELTGDGLYFHWLNVEDFLRAHGVYGNDDPLVKEGYAENYGTTFTVDYDQQNLSENDIQCEVHVPVDMEGDLLALSDEMDATRYAEELGDEYIKLSNQFYTALFSQAADKLAQSTFTMTATFTDGTTQTKSYTIAPVENFEEIYDAYQTDIETDVPALFTITENA